MSADKFKEIMSNPEVQMKPPDKSQTQEVGEPSGPKIGQGHAMAMLRLGGHEITQALQAFPDSNIRPMEEPGVFGNENAPQRVPPKEGADKAIVSEATEMSLKEILDAPTPPTPPTMERDNGREM